jgi:hypothetical protein
MNEFRIQKEKRGGMCCLAYACRVPFHIEVSYLGKLYLLYLVELSIL